MSAKFLFPAWLVRARPLAGAALAVAPLYAVGLVYFAGSPTTTDVGYSPEQPIPFSHAQHAGQMGIDCRYCHTTVETAAFAAVPPTSVCMNCHRMIAPDAKQLATKIQPLVQSDESGESVPWVRVHDLPDFVYFDHSAHVTRGVSCVSCHDRVDTMAEVYQAKTLSMAWCLECHRNPAPHIRPSEHVTDLDWISDEDPLELGCRLVDENGIAPSTDCSTCHR